MQLRSFHGNSSLQVPKYNMANVVIQNDTIAEDSQK